MLLLDQWGAFQTVSWWNSLTQCPAYQPTIDYYVALTKKIIGDWGFEGLKLDGQHLNSVAPCYNKAHKHSHPTESVEKLGDFWKAIHKAAREANPEAVVELCPCGTVFNFHNLPATDQYPSSDPLIFLAGAQQGQDASRRSSGAAAASPAITWSCPTAAMTSRRAWASAR